MIDNRFIEYCINRSLFSRENINAISIPDDSSAYDAIIHSGLTTQQQLAIAAGDYYKVPVADVNQIKPDPSALTCGNPTLCRRLLFLPFSIDPSAGLLIAIADLTNQDLVRNFMRGKGIIKMSFYIAPYDDLVRLINNSYERPRETSGFIQVPDSLRTGATQTSGLLQIPDNVRGTSGFRKPSINLDEITAFPAAAVNADQSQLLSKLVAAIDTLKADNAALHQQVDKLTLMLELETTFTRELVKNLKNGGTISAVAFEQLLDILK